MSSPPIRLPSGVRDFLPRAAARRRSLAEKMMAVFEAWGYARVITPVFECADVLERGLGAGGRTARGMIAAALARKDRGGLRTAARALPEGVAPLAEALATLWGSATATLARAAALPWPPAVQAALAQLGAVLAAFGQLAEPPAPA